MRRTWLIVLSGILCTLLQSVSAQSTDSELTSDTLIIADTLLSNTADSVPDWYVEPEIPLRLRAPKRAAAANVCDKVAAIESYDINSILIEVTFYEYDNTGRVISTTVWTHHDDGSQTGKSRLEYGFDTYGNQVSTVEYDWDNAMNIWHGVSRYEYVYDSKHRMLSSIEYAWINYEWIANIKYTWAYDAEGREAEYYSYSRNTATNQLVPVNGFIYTWLDDTQKSLEIIYTAYSNGAWSAGTKKIWEFDTNGNQTLYEYYSSISNGNWIGNTKETWTFGGPTGQLTLHEKYTWNSGWSKTLKEETVYTGNYITRIENYSYTNGVEKGEKKEEYSYTNGKQTQTIIYTWVSGAWVGSSNETWVYGGPSGQLTLHEQFTWASSDWSKTLREETEYSGANVIRIENYTYANGVPTGTKKETTAYTNGKKTEFITYTWGTNDWVGATKETWTYGGSSGQLTLHEQFEGVNNNWSNTLKEETQYSGANIVRVENYTYANGVPTGTKKETYAYTNGKKTEEIIFTWENNDWVGSTRDVWAYNTSKLQTLHEKYEWENGDWLLMTQENTTYSGSNVASIENYERIEGVWTGTQKEAYTYASGKKVTSIVYLWVNAAWIEFSKEVWGFTSGKQTLYETYAWNGSWVMTLQENTLYDGENIIKIENYALIEGVWGGTKKEEYTYTSGEKTMTVVYAWANNDWVYSTKNEAGYKDGNIEVSATNYAWDGSTWIGTGTRTQTTYDNNKVIEKLTQNWPEGATSWTNAAITTNTYNSDGVNILTYNGTWNGSRWVVSSMTRTDFVWDDFGNQLLKASWKCSADSNWIGVQKDTAKYTATNHLLYSAQYTSWANNNWVASYRVEYEYDNADRVTLNQRYNWKNNKWQGAYKYEYKYDAQGRQISSTSYTSWNRTKNTWIGTTKKEIEYYDDGRIKSSIDYDWSNNAWYPSFQYFYKYDSNGQELERVIQYYSGGSWVNMLKYENAYSGNKQTKSNSYSWLNNQWVYSSRSESMYDDSSSETLRRQITGSWASGSLLSYSDNRYFYNCDPHFYTIGFINFDGKGLEYQTLVEGQTPEYKGETPTKPSTTDYSYEFAGWTPKIVPANGDATYTASFTESARKYTITFYDEDGETILSQQDWDYNATPTCDEPTKEATDQYTFEFSGWTPEVVAVTGEASYTATYRSTVNQYTITFYDEDGETILSQQDWDYNATPTCDEPTKEATDQYTYEFSGWTPEVVAVTGEATYTATYRSTVNQYTVIFKNGDEVLQSGEVEYGSTPAYTGETPTKEADAQFTYTFSGWSPEITAVQGEQTYTAQFSTTVNKYTVTFKNGDEILQSGEVEYGSTPAYNGETPTKDADAQYTYTFSGWSPEVAAVEGAQTYTAQFNTTVNKYTVTFKNGDEVLQSTEEEYGETPSYTGAKPTKEADAQYTYDFKEWSPALTEVQGEQTYTAQFSTTVNKYTVTFKNGDEVLQSTEVAYGEMPVYEGETPTKDADEHDSYVFANWSPEIKEVEGDVTYIATFTPIKKSYLVTFKNGDEVLQSSEVAYGEMPVYEGETPTKDADAQYTYTFSGWSPEVAAVEGTQTYTAQFSSTVNKYIVTFKNGDEVLQSGEVEFGSTPSYTGETPTKEADAQYTYTFSSWDPALTEVQGEQTYTAQFNTTVNKYTVTFKNGDEVLQSTEVAYGETPSYTGANPTKEADAQYTYDFKEWSPEITAVQGVQTYTAQFNTTVNKYTVTFKNGDEVLQSSEVAYGETPSYTSATPTKEADAQYTYDFKEWSPEISAVQGAQTYTAQFNTTVNKYTVTFKNGDEVLQSSEVAYGEMPVYEGETPTKDADAQYTYTFSSWNPVLTEVQGEQTYTAQFSTTVNKYTVTFKNGDEVLQSSEVAYGEMPSYIGENPTKEADAQYTYDFKEWSPALTEVQGEQTYTAQFSTTVNKYTVTFKNGDEILQSTEVAYGDMPSYTSANPTKEATDEFTYTFAGWTPEIVAVVGETTYTATFSETKNSYTIIWLHEDGTEIDRTMVEYGVVPTHDDAEKEPTADFTYTFAGWTPEIVAVNGEATYTATFNEETRLYTILFMNGDEVLQSDELAFGATPTYNGAEPAKEATAEFTYTFAGWDPEIVNVAGDATYQATFTPIKNKYTITFLHEDGTELQSSEVAYGEVPTYDGETPTKEGTVEVSYAFAGWTPEVVAVTADATYSATFTETKNTFTITWLNEDGSEIDQTTVAYGIVPEHDDPTKANTPEFTYVFAGWIPMVVAATDDATYTAVFAEYKNKYAITFLNEDGTELQRSEVAYGEMPTYDGETPTKEATAEFTYTFAGWDYEPTEVTGAAIYTATYTETRNSYTITWLNEDGSEIDHETLEYGATPAHADIYKESTSEYSYEFAGWDPEIAPVTGDATYTATFTASYIHNETDLGPNIVPEDSNGDPVVLPVDHGTTIYLRVTLDDCHTFHWSDILDSLHADYRINPRPFVYDGLKPEYTAVIETYRYHISANADDATHGEVSVRIAEDESANPKQELTVDCGTWVELRAANSDMWHFVQWNDGETDSVRLVEATADAQYIASYEPNCGDYPTLPVVSLYDWLLMLDVRSIHAMGYMFGEEDVTWYRVHGEPDKLTDGASADDERLGTGYSFTLDQSLVNTGDYYAMIDVSDSPTGALCTDMMRSKIVHYAASATAAAAPPMLQPALVRPYEPQQVLHLNADQPTTITIYDIYGHQIRTFSEEGVDRMSLQAEGVAGCYQVVVLNGDQRTVLRYIVVQ